MLLDLATRRRVMFLGGKGGVGKTSVSSALALAQSRLGRRVLLVSTDPAHNLAHLWDTRIGDRVTTLAPGLDALEIDPDATTAAHLASVGDSIRRFTPPHLAAQVRSHLELARHAPEAHEAALLERLASIVTSSLTDYDLIVFDTAPSGHTARLMALPQAMTAWTEGLLRRRDKADRFAAVMGGIDDDRRGRDLIRSDTVTDPDHEIRTLLLRRRRLLGGLREVITDPQRCSFVVVTAAERLPVAETIELVERLQAPGVSVGGLVVNRRSPADAGPVLARRREREADHLATLTGALPTLPVTEILLVDGDVVGPSGMARLADLLLVDQGRAHTGPVYPARSGSSRVATAPVAGARS